MLDSFFPDENFVRSHNGIELLVLRLTVLCLYEALDILHVSIVVAGVAETLLVVFLILDNSLALSKLFSSSIRVP
jgi:hypothetical protein